MSTEEKEITIVEIRETIKKLDPNMDENSESFLAAQFLLSSLYAGTRISHIAKFMGVRWCTLKKFHYRAELNGIFQNGQIYANWFDEGEAAGISFLCDVNVVCGLMDRSLNASS